MLPRTRLGAATEVRPPTINAIVTVLGFFFKVTLDHPDITRHLVFVYEPRKSRNAAVNTCYSFAPQLILKWAFARPWPTPNVSGEMNFPIARLVCDQINLAVVIPCHI